MLAILHTESSANWGGQEYRAVEQMTWLSRRGYRVGIACPPSSAIAEQARRLGLTVHEETFSGNYNPAGWSRARLLLLRHKYDVVDCHGSRDSNAFALSRDLCPVVRTRHLAHPLKFSWRRHLMWHRGCDHVIATADCIKAMLVAHGLTSGNRVSVIGEWAAPEFFGIAAKDRLRAEIRTQLGLADDARIVVNVGMLRVDKGQDQLIRAAALWRDRGCDAYLVLVGGATSETDGYEAMLRRLVADLHLGDRVVFTGYRDDVHRFVLAADCQVVASLAEAQSRSVPQAFAAVIPVVATRVGGVPELVEHDRSGLLVEPGDPDAIARSVVAVLTDGESARSRAERARHFAERHLSLDAKMEETVALYERLAQSKRQRP